MRVAPVAAVGVAALFGLVPHTSHADRLLPVVAVPVATPATTDTLRALDRLHQYGYTINTPARAARAIRHWQQANGLQVDGVVGRATLASLGLDPLPPAVAGSTTPPPPIGPVGAGDVETLIRSMWPDDSENEAVRIATRESRLVPTASNACCFGLFQVHFRAHRAWLAGYGVTTPSDLLDPTTNITVALALFQQAGWGPWRL
jgi:peptidoglycan hydrolase-like protein with peptidoglycan-binding domain